MTQITAPNVSGYVRESAARAASQPSETEARAQRSGDNVVTLPNAADEAQAAFLTFAQTTSETARLLFEARSVVQDLEQRDYLGQRAFDERLIAECKRLTNGDELKARLLASAALEG